MVARQALCCERIEPAKTWCELLALSPNPVHVKVIADLSPKDAVTKGWIYNVNIISSSKVTTNPKNLKVKTGGIFGCGYPLKVNTEYLLNLDSSNQFYDSFSTISRPWSALSYDQKCAFANKGNCCVNAIKGGCPNPEEICNIVDGKAAYCGKTCWSVSPPCSYPDSCTVDSLVYPPVTTCERATPAPTPSTPAPAL